MSNFIGGPKPVLKDPRTNHIKMYIRQIKNGGRFSNMSKRDMNSSRFDSGAGNLKEFDLMPRKTFVFDISKGNNLAEALERFDAASEHEPVYTFILGGAGNGAPSPCTNFYIERDAQGKDAKLYLFAARGESGFVIVEVPMAQDKDD